jgi:membrane-associated protease RseP (regulator of RpoE activity)
VNILKRIALAAAMVFFAAVSWVEPSFLLILPMIFGHELAHGLAAAGLGAKVRRLGIGMGPVSRTLGTVRGLEVVLSKYPVGLYVGIDAESHDRLSRPGRLLIAFVGIAYNLAFGAAIVALGGPWYLAKVSFLLAVMNMVPLLPLDGGRAVAHFLDAEQLVRFKALSARLFVPVVAVLTVLSILV